MYMNNLKIGSKGDNVAQLQQFLKGIGLYSGNIDGIFGPKTDAAVRQFQSSQNIKNDGIVGPITDSKIKSFGAKQEIKNDPIVQNVIANDPIASQVLSTLDANGDLGADYLYDYVSKNQGMPFDKALFDKTYNDFLNQSQAYYKQLQDYDTASIENQLGLQQKNFQSYLDDAAAQFGQDKDAADTSAAQRGVLFSTGRQQDLTNLQNKYNSDLSQKRDAYASNMTNQLLNYQNKWGGGSMGNLGSYMNLGGQAYDAFTPRGKVTASGLSQFYNPSAYNLSGTEKAKQVKNAASGALTYLANFNNKSNLAGYNTQY